MKFLNKSIFFCLLSISISKFNLNYCMEERGQSRLRIPKTFVVYGYSWESNFDNPVILFKESVLLNAIESLDIDKIKQEIENGIDVNLPQTKSRNGIQGNEILPMGLLIKKASSAFEFFTQNREEGLKTLELFLQKGAILNDRLYDGHTALEVALLVDKSEPRIIKLLLNYGSEITQNDFEIVSRNFWGNPRNEIINILEEHQNLRNQARTNPTRELLNQMIRSNNIFGVKLIVENQPNLITIADVELAQELIPMSAPILANAFKLARFYAITNAQGIPQELVQFIEKIIEKNGYKNSI